MILQKYVAAINSLAIVVLSALIAIPSGQLNWTSGAQIASIAISGIVLYIAPLLNISWQGILKTGAAIVGALVATAFPIFQTVVEGKPFEPIYIALIVLSAAHALGTQLGVDIRTDTAALLGSSATDTTPTQSSVNQDEVAAGTFAVGAGLQQVVQPETAQTAANPATGVAYNAAPAYSSVDTTTMSAVNPANQE